MFSRLVTAPTKNQGRGPVLNFIIGAIVTTRVYRVGRDAASWREIKPDIDMPTIEIVEEGGIRDWQTLCASEM